MPPDEWLPELITLGESGGEWHRYLETLREAFAHTYLGGHHALHGKRISIRRFPEQNGMHGGFWHLITEGPTEANRTPSIGRCERLLWPIAMIQQAHTDDVLVWRKQDARHGETVMLALPDFSYVVVLRARPEHLLLVTAYCVEYDSRRQKLRKEYEVSEKC